MFENAYAARLGLDLTTGVLTTFQTANSIFIFDAYGHEIEIDVFGIVTQMGVSDRWVRTLRERMKQSGDAAVVHGLRGRASNRRLPVETLQQALPRILRRYEGTDRYVMGCVRPARKAGLPPREPSP